MTQSCHTEFGNHTNFSRRKTNSGISTLNSHQLSKCSCPTDNLPPLPRLQLNVINFHADWNMFKLEAIACLNFSFLQRRNYGNSYSKSNRRNNITFFSICIMKKSQPSTTIGVVFYGSYNGWNVKFITFKIHKSDSSSGSTTAVTYSYFSICTSTKLFSFNSQLSFRSCLCDIRKIINT